LNEAKHQADDESASTAEEDHKQHLVSQCIRNFAAEKTEAFSDKAVLQLRTATSIAVVEASAGLKFNSSLAACSLSKNRAEPKTTIIAGMIQVKRER